MNRQFFSFLGRLFGQSDTGRSSGPCRSHSSAAKRKARWQPSIEQLEVRMVPAVTSFTLGAGYGSCPPDGTNPCLTNQTGVYLQGFGAPNASVELDAFPGGVAFYDSTGSLVPVTNSHPTVSTDNNGYFVVWAKFPGNDIYGLSASDDGGNSFKSLTIDLNTTPPPVPGISLVNNNNTANPTLVGQGTIPGDRIVLLEGTQPVGKGTVDANGNWTAKISGLAPGQHALVAQEVDAYGNVSGTSDPIQVTIPAPAVPPPVQPPAVQPPATNPGNAAARLNLLAQQQQEQADLLARQQQQLKQLRRHHAPARKIRQVKAQQARDMNALLARQAAELSLVS